LLVLDCLRLDLLEFVETVVVLVSPLHRPKGHLATDLYYNKGLRCLPPPRGAVWEPVSCVDELAEPREDRWSAVGAGAGVLAVAAVNSKVGMKTVVRAVVRLVGHLMLVLVRHEKGKLIYTHCHVITSHKLSLAGVLFKQQLHCSNSNGVVAYEEVTSQQKGRSYGVKHLRDNIDCSQRGIDLLLLFCMKTRYFESCTKITYSALWTIVDC